MATTPEATKQVPKLVGNPAPTLRADFNSLADYIRDEIQAAVANAAALPATNNFDGRQRWDKDAKALKVNDTGTWYPATPGGGLVPVIPTSVAGTGVTLGSGGKVSFSSSSTVSVNGCFTTTYDEYLVKLRFTTSTSASGSIRLRNAGSDISTSTYDHQALQAAGTADATGVRVQATSSVQTYGTVLASEIAMSVNVSSPKLVARTLFDVISDVIETAANTPYRITYMGGNRNATAYDGFSIFPSAGSLTGSLRVYGYNNN